MSHTPHLLHGRDRIAYRIWQSSRWFHYFFAVSCTALTGAVRIILQPVLQERIQFILFTIPIAMAAFVGGFYPGLVATILACVIATFLIGPQAYLNSDMPIPSPTAQMQTTGLLILTWIFLCFVCEIMRNAALNLQAANQDRDATQAGLNQLLDRISDGFVAVNKQNKVVYINRAFRELLKPPHTSEEILLSDVSLVNFSGLPEALGVSTPTSTDILNESENRWYRLSSFPDQEGTSIFIQDITIQKTNEVAQERLILQERKLRNDAEQASKMRDEFVATTSHELRTPLTTILGWSEILQRRNKQEDLKEGLIAIERSTRAQVQLINDLLDISRLATGKMMLDFQIIPLPDLIDQVCKSMEPTANHKGVKLVKDQEAEVYVRADPERLSQVFTNLLSNAIKFTPQGGVVSIHIENTSEDSITVSVKDTGEGIDSAQLENIFLRFRQANSTASRKHGGLGIGLAIAKELVEGHSGKIEAFSEGPNRGAEFRVTLPKASPKSSADSRLSGVLPSADMLEGISILIVEDDEGTQTILEMLLYEAGADIRVASNGFQALEILTKFAPHVVVSDIGMPEMDGYELLSRIKKLPSQVGDKRAKVLALSAFATVQDKQKAIEAGFDDFLAKPIDGMRLRSVVKRLTEPQS